VSSVKRYKRTDKIKIGGRSIRAANLVNKLIAIDGIYCMIARMVCRKCSAEHLIQTTDSKITIVCHCGTRLSWATDIRFDNVALYPNRGKLVSIVGKGPTAPFYEKLDLIIGINEAVHLIDEDVSVILARGDVGPFLPKGSLPPNVIPIVPDLLKGVYDNAYYFDYVKDLGMPRRLCTVCYAIALACYLGAEQIRMYGFDALAHGDYSYIIKNERNNAPLADQKPQLRQLPFDMIAKCYVMDKPVCNLVRLRDLL
jgi:hypothetical protein